MISTDSIYNKIVADIEKNLPISVNRPNRTNRKNPNIKVAENEAISQSFGAVLENTGNINSSPASQNSAPPGSIMERIEAAIRNASAKYNIDYALIKGVIKAESSFNPNDVSTAGAQGLMQLMPGTASSLGVLDPFNIEQNIDGGTKYLRQMLDRFNNDVTLALAAYNAGPGNVEKYGGIPPFKETQTYVPRVLNNAEQFRKG